MVNSKEIAQNMENLVQLFPAFFREIINELRRRDKQLATSAQFRTLSAIEKGGSWRMSDLSEKLRVSNGSLTIMVNRLIEEGLVSRGRSEKDRRVVTVQLTDKGHEFLQQQKEMVRNMMAEYIDRLSTAEQEELANAINVCTEYMRKLLQQ